jgi:glutamine synthetase
MDLAARKLEGIDSLPENLYEAIDELRKDKLVQKALGQHVYSRFVLAKTREWENYSSQVFKWELDEYLEKF